MYPKIKEGNSIGSIKQMHFEQRGTQKPPKNAQLGELMVLKDLMTPLLTSVSFMTVIKAETKTCHKHLLLQTTTRVLLLPELVSG